MAFNPPIYNIDNSDGRPAHPTVMQRRKMLEWTLILQGFKGQFCWAKTQSTEMKRSKVGDSYFIVTITKLLTFHLNE